MAASVTIQEDNVTLQIATTSVVGGLPAPTGNDDFALTEVSSVPGWRDISPNTTAPITLAVSATGDDSDPARPGTIRGGDFSANPFLTIQAAIDSLPKDLLHSPSVDIGPGNFAGFQALGFNGESIAISGSSGFTPATGPTSGTFTSADRFSATLAGAGWTTDDLMGSLAFVISGTGAGQAFSILKNTADKLSFSRRQSPLLDATSAFSIVGFSTVLTSAGPESGHVISVKGCLSPVSLIGLKTNAGLFGFAFGFINCAQVTATICADISAGEFFSVNAERCQQVILRRFAAVGASGITSISATACGDVFFDDTGMRDGFISATASQKVSSSGVYAEGTSAALSLDGINKVTIDRPIVDGGPITARGCSDVVLSAAAADGTDVSNSADGIVLERSTLEVTGALGGTGNSGWGVKLADIDSTFALSGGPTTITGTSGDFTVDGAAAKTWAGDVPAAGNSEVDAGRGNRVIRLL